MSKKNQALKDCVKVMKRPNVAEWYKENMESKKQLNTVSALREAVHLGKLTVEEALSIALVVGVQWNVKFEGVP
jgi:hypothetical protein